MRLLRSGTDGFFSVGLCLSGSVMIGDARLTCTVSANASRCRAATDDVGELFAGVVLASEAVATASLLAGEKN
jgi:hypothetical protein